MKYIASWSGGKDSTASIILAHEHNEPIDMIIFSEVMFDKKNQISGENPQSIKFVYDVAIPMFESWGYTVKVLRADRDYLDVFHRVVKRATKHPEHVGMQYGFVISGLCSAKRDLKLKPINDYLKSFKGQQITQYIGIASDEPDRLVSMHKKADQVSLLEKYGYTESMAMELCKKYGLLSPQYELSCRGGCWFCPNAKLSEHRYIKENMPDAWNAFCSLEDETNVAQNRWNVYTNETLKDRDRKIDLDIKKELPGYQFTIFDYC